MWQVQIAQIFIAWNPLKAMFAFTFKFAMKNIADEGILVHSF